MFIIRFQRIASDYYDNDVSYYDSLLCEDVEEVEKWLLENPSKSYELFKATPVRVLTTFTIVED